MEESAIDPELGSDDEYNSENDEPVGETVTDPTIADVDSDIESEAESTGDSDLDYASDPELDATNEPSIQINVNEVEEEQEEEDDDDSLSENYDEYLQKLDKQFITSIVDDYHNEEYHINPDEMNKLCQIKKNNKGFIDDPLHKTSPIMSKYEYTNIIGLRTKQLGDGAPPMIDVVDGIIENFIIAEIELKQKVLPFVIKRPLSHGGCEYWRISDLEILL
jgi:DNA-directed RNA polymerase subunit K/omega